MKRIPGEMGVARSDTVALAGLSRIVACEERLEEALTFLAANLGARPKRGKKPVLLHSLRVAYFLLARGLAPDVVIAGLLHDVLEKTTLSPGQIARRFGTDVSLIVAATTNNPRIDDPLLRYQDSLQRCSALGPEALTVRAADLIDNCDRLFVLGSYGRLARVGEKLRMLIRVSRDVGVAPEVVDELARRVKRINRKIGGLDLLGRKGQPALSKKSARS